MQIIFGCPLVVRCPGLPLIIEVIKLIYELICGELILLPLNAITNYDRLGTDSLGREGGRGGGGGGGGEGGGRASRDRGASTVEQCAPTAALTICTSFFAASLRHRGKGI